MQQPQEILAELKKSKFRARFSLKKRDFDYINKIGLEKLKAHTLDFIHQRLADTSKITDGKQTPMHGHPVFIAQHATATCCRECLQKWHHIDKQHYLTQQEIDYIASVILTWIENQLKLFDKQQPTTQTVPTTRARKKVTQLDMFDDNF